MNTAYDRILVALFLVALLYSIFLYQRYRNQKLALQKCLALTDRFHTVGEMAACVTHEIRNPLTTIHGYLQIFAQKQEFARYQGQLALLLEELDRANSLITEYLSLCRENTVDLKPMQLNAIISAMVPLMQAHANSTGKDIHLELENVPEISLDAKEIRQLILNLARNGLEAMDQGKTLSIRTYADTAKQQVVLYVQDQGRGIPPQVLKNLGKPFITTKENGTGLGLAVCYQIVERHRGKIHVETGKDGTVFYISFPY